MKILIVLTSHDQLGDTGEKTGFWLEELAAPYFVLKDAGAKLTLASPAGGAPPLDPKSEAPDFQTDATRRFTADASAQAQLANTVKLSSLRSNDFDAVFFPGGHGPIWDLAEDRHSIALIEAMAAAGKPIGAVCHGVAALRNVKDANGAPLVQGRKVAGFTDTEEDAVGLSDVVPYSIEDMYRLKGARFERGEDWAAFVVSDGGLVTGQNPASSSEVAQQVLKLATVAAR